MKLVGEVSGIKIYALDKLIELTLNGSLFKKVISSYTEDPTFPNF